MSTLEEMEAEWQRVKRDPDRDSASVTNHEGRFAKGTKFTEGSRFSSRTKSS